MNVYELIEALQQVEDKSKEVHITVSNGFDTDGGSPFLEERPVERIQEESALVVISDKITADWSDEEAKKYF